MFDSSLLIVIVCGSLVLVVLASTFQLPSLSAVALISSLSQEALMVIYSLAFAQPQSVIVVLR